MKPRARRVTIAAAVLGVAVVGVLVVAHWGKVRDHVEAWHFQLTRETVTIPIDGGAVIFDPTMFPMFGRHDRIIEQRFPRRAYVVFRESAAPADDTPTMETLLVPFGDPAPVRSP